MSPALLLFTVLAIASAPVISMGAVWYVAPGGSDDAAGSLEQPFASIQRGQSAAVPGDTVFIRGGTYRMTEADLVRRRGLFARLIVLDKSGTKEKPIRYRAWENEKPVFDCSAVKPPGQRVTTFYVSGSWLHLQGIEVTGVQVTIKTHTQSICFESQGSHNTFERLSMHDGQAIGIYHVNGSDNLFLNCDAWNNWDYTSEGGKGGNVDGFGCHPTRGSSGNVFRGCRAWFNSDDGFDCIGAQESVRFENCLAAWSGFTPKFQRTGDGNGFKAGGYGSASADSLPTPVPRHIIRLCLAVGNRSSGFYANHHPGGCDWINNTAYKNGANFNMLGRLADNRTDVDGCDHRLLNNLSYRSRRDISRINASKCTLTGNSFTLNLNLSHKDFLNLDESAILQARQPDGSPPISNFMRPAPGSSLIDAGAMNDLRFTGKAPDIGALEEQSTPRE